MGLSSEPTTDNGRLIASLYEAFGRGDVPYVLQHIAPDVEWIETEHTGLPVHGTHRSPDAVVNEVFAQIPEHFESFLLEPDFFIEVDDEVVVTGRLRARTRSGRDLDAPYAHVFTVRDGKIARTDNHHDTALWRAALEA